MARLLPFLPPVERVGIRLLNDRLINSRIRDEARNWPFGGGGGVAKIHATRKYLRLFAKSPLTLSEYAHFLKFPFNYPT